MAVGPRRKREKKKSPRQHTSRRLSIIPPYRVHGEVLAAGEEKKGCLMDSEGDGGRKERGEAGLYPATDPGSPLPPRLREGSLRRDPSVTFFPLCPQLRGAEISPQHQSTSKTCRFRVCPPLAMSLPTKPGCSHSEWEFY